MRRKETAVLEPPHLLADLKTLALPAVVANWERLAVEAERKRQSHPEYLTELAHLEVTQRRERRIARLIKEARFPVIKTLEGFDFQAQAGLDREAVLELARCDFVDQKHNVVLIGGIGTGKTHLAIALGLACCQREKRVRFLTAAEAANELSEAKAQDRLSRKLEQLARYDLLVLDELGYVPFDRRDADLLFGLVTKWKRHAKSDPPGARNLTHPKPSPGKLSAARQQQPRRRNDRGESGSGV
jgi:DNA replication protein DnaC